MCIKRRQDAVKFLVSGKICIKFFWLRACYWFTGKQRNLSKAKLQEWNEILQLDYHSK